MKKILLIIQKIFQKVGISIRPYTPSTNSELRLSKTIEYLNIDYIIDVGANEGQFAEKMIDNGYNGKIISFEPIKQCHDKLLRKSKNNDNWIIGDRVAVGSTNGDIEINVSSNLVSSSILDIKQNHLSAEPESKFIAKEKIEVKKLDDILSFDEIKTKNILIKIDVQGYEMEVLKGANAILECSKMICIELSLVTVYENSMPYDKVISYLNDKEYFLFGLQSGFVDNYTGQVYQVDGIFVKKDSVK